MIESIKNPIPSALGMREITDATLEMQASRELMELRIDITRAAKDGKYSIIRDGSLSAETRAAVKKAGYAITFGTYEEKYCISWK